MPTDPYRWKRLTPFEFQETTKETWILEKGRQSFEFDVDVRFGKDLNVGQVKKKWPYQIEIGLVREKLRFFERAADFISLDRCPVCRKEKLCAAYKVTICGVDYLKCGNCTHVYASIAPSPVGAGCCSMRS